MKDFILTLLVLTIFHTPKLAGQNSIESTIELEFNIDSNGDIAVDY